MIYKRISGCVTTLNNERCIVPCLESLARLCAEIVVVDGRSTDRTRELARGCGAQVIESAFLAHDSLKQFAANAANNEWVLCLDAEERLSPELAAEILRVNLHGLDVCAAYELPFRGAAAQPDYHVRLFDRRRAAYRGRAGHERVIAHGPIGRFRNLALHDSNYGARLIPGHAAVQRRAGPRRDV